MWNTRNTYRFSVLKSEGKIPLDRPGRKWEKNNKMDLEETLERMWSEY
jgi:hypothetical protein